jgi:CAAX prenyl protease-like protein
MQRLFERLARFPTLVRVIPFVLFLLLTSGQGAFGEASRYWLYLFKTILGAGMLFVMWPHVVEMRWKFSWEAVVVGVAVFLVWVGLDGHYPALDVLLQKAGLSKGATTATLWNPHTQFGEGLALAWFFVAVRFIGSAIVVPPLEEVFYRSFLYRYAINPAFQGVPLGRFVPGPFFIVSLIFGLAHFEWLPGILCAFAYQGLVVWKNRLGDAMTAHAITNLLLGVWVVWKGAWHFW